MKTIEEKSESLRNQTKMDKEGDTSYAHALIRNTKAGTLHALILSSHYIATFLNQIMYLNIFRL